MGLFLGWVGLCIIVNLALIGLVFWAVIKLVKKFTK